MCKRVHESIIKDDRSASILHFAMGCNSPTFVFLPKSECRTEREGNGEGRSTKDTIMCW